MASERLAVYIVIAVLIVGALDSAVKELTWMPYQVKVVGFYAFPPVMLAGMILLVPYLRTRMAVVTSGSARKYAINAYVGVTAVALAIWAVMYYQAVISGGPDMDVSWALKDSIILFGAVMYALLAKRLISWYRKTRNKVVLFFSLNIATFVVFIALHFVSDYVAKPLPRIIPDALAASFVVFMWTAYLALITMYRTYYGNFRNGALAVILIAPILITALFLALRLAIPLSTELRTVLSLGLELSPLVYLWGYFLLLPALTNETSKGYYRSVALGHGLGASANCGMGLALLLAFPVSGFASLTLLIPAAIVSYAAFMSSASYFSISEEVRKEIREATGLGFGAAIGAAESILTTDEQIKGFYDRFTGLAKESGAVEAEALSENDIYEYVAALKKAKQVGITK